MQLTLTPIDSVLQTGFAEHSHIAKHIINTLKSEHNIHVVACYIQTSTHLLIPPNSSLDHLIKSNKIEFTNETILTFYIHSKKSMISPTDKNLNKILHNTFWDYLYSTGLSLNYERLYLPEEINYYGWNRPQNNDFITQNIIQTKPAVKNNEIINIECIDQLALWNYISNALNSANNFELIKQINAKVYVSFHEGIPVYFIILPHEHISNMLYSDFSEKFSIYMTSILKPIDIWDVVSIDSMTPIISTWESLSKEQRFSLSKN